MSVNLAILGLWEDVGRFYRTFGKLQIYLLGEETRKGFATEGDSPVTENK